MIKAIYFDFHGVITQGDFADIYQNVAKRVDVPTQQVVEYHHTYLPDMLTGQVTPKDMIEKLGLSQKIQVTDFLHIWKEEIVRLTKLDSRMLQLLTTLRETYTLAALTNLTAERYEADKALGLYEYFDHCVLSCKEGIKKPDKKFFLRGFELTGNAPEEVIFIDDQEKNTDCAAELGATSILYKDYETLISNLRTFGVQV